MKVHKRARLPSFLFISAGLSFALAKKMNIAIWRRLGRKLAPMPTMLGGGTLVHFVRRGLINK